MLLRTDYVLYNMLCNMLCRYIAVTDISCYIHYYIANRN